MWENIPFSGMSFVHTVLSYDINDELFFFVCFVLLVLQVLSAECRANFITVSTADVLSPWLVSSCCLFVILKQRC